MYSQYFIALVAALAFVNGSWDDFALNHISIASFQPHSETTISAAYSSNAGNSARNRLSINLPLEFSPNGKVIPIFVRYHVIDPHNLSQLKMDASHATHDLVGMPWTHNVDLEKERDASNSNGVYFMDKPIEIGGIFCRPGAQTALTLSLCLEGRMNESVVVKEYSFFLSINCPKQSRLPLPDWAQPRKSEEAADVIDDNFALDQITIVSGDRYLRLAVDSFGNAHIANPLSRLDDTIHVQYLDQANVLLIHFCYHLNNCSDASALKMAVIYEMEYTNNSRCGYFTRPSVPKTTIFTAVNFIDDPIIIKSGAFCEGHTLRIKIFLENTITMASRTYSFSFPVQFPCVSAKASGTGPKSEQPPLMSTEDVNRLSKLMCELI